MIEVDRTTASAERAVPTCSADGSALVLTGETRSAMHVTYRDFVCSTEGHVWVEATGLDGIREWTQIDARQGGLL